MSYLVEMRNAVRFREDLVLFIEALCIPETRSGCERGIINR